MGMVRSTVSCLAVAAMLMTMAKATSYTVGEADGWSSGGDYTTWVSGKTFKVGDKIVFTYLPNHDVLEVLKVDYESCTGSSPISSDSSGSTTISLTAVGNRYFICGTIGHCDQGMKLQVEVLGSSSSSPPPPSPVIPPPSPPLGTPPPSPRAATPPPSPRVATPPPPVATPPPSPRVASPPPPVATPPPATPPVATPPPATPPTTTPASPPVSSPPPKTHTPKSAPTPAKSPTSTPKVGAPSPTVSKVTPTPRPSSAYKISYVASFAFAWMMLAAAI